MTEEEAMKNIKSMFPDLLAYLEIRCRELLLSGAADYSVESPDDFWFPKLVLTAALQDAADGLYSPLPSDEEGKIILRNLRCF